MVLTPNIRKAINTASSLHVGQKRKADGLPFISHPYAVALTLSKYTDDESIIIAGLLHDVLEDVRDYSFTEMKRDFGERVASIVHAVSEDKDPRMATDERRTWRTRKERYLAHLKGADEAALMVCAADKIHNMLSLMDAYKEQGEAIWSHFNASKEDSAWFLREATTLLQTSLRNGIIAELISVRGDLFRTVFGEKEHTSAIEFHNKLVRDNIPEIIRADEREPVTTRLDKKEYIIALLEKLIEESTEARNAGGAPHELMKEIGDVLEVIDALEDAFGLDKRTIEELKEKRRKTRGGFEKRIFLKWIE